MVFIIVALPFLTGFTEAFTQSRKIFEQKKRFNTSNTTAIIVKR